MTYDCLIDEVDEDHICWITLNRPEKLNAFNNQLCSEFGQALKRADRDKERECDRSAWCRPRVLLWTRPDGRYRQLSRSDVSDVVLSDRDLQRFHPRNSRQGPEVGTWHGKCTLREMSFL